MLERVEDVSLRVADSQASSGEKSGSQRADDVHCLTLRDIIYIKQSEQT